MNDHINHWNEIKTDLKKTWASLTDADLDRAKNNLNHLADVLQDKYQITKEQANEQIHHIITRFKTQDTHPKNRSQRPNHNRQRTASHDATL